MPRMEMGLAGRTAQSPTTTSKAYRTIRADRRAKFA